MKVKRMSALINNRAGILKQINKRDESSGVASIMTLYKSPIERNLILTKQAANHVTKLKKLELHLEELERKIDKLIVRHMLNLRRQGNPLWLYFPGFCYGYGPYRCDCADEIFEKCAGASSYTLDPDDTDLGDEEHECKCWQPPMLSYLELQQFQKEVMKKNSTRNDVLETFLVLDESRKSIYDKIIPKLNLQMDKTIFWHDPKFDDNEPGQDDDVQSSRLQEAWKKFGILQDYVERNNSSDQSLGIDLDNLRKRIIKLDRMEKTLKKLEKNRSHVVHEGSIEGMNSCNSDTDAGDKSDSLVVTNDSKLRSKLIKIEQPNEIWDDINKFISSPQVEQDFEHLKQLLKNAFNYKLFSTHSQIELEEVIQKKYKNLKNENKIGESDSFKRSHQNLNLMEIKNQENTLIYEETFSDESVEQEQLEPNPGIDVAQDERIEDIEDMTRNEDSCDSEEEENEPIIQWPTSYTGPSKEVFEFDDRPNDIRRKLSQILEEDSRDQFADLDNSTNIPIIFYFSREKKRRSRRASRSRDRSYLVPQKSSEELFKDVEDAKDMSPGIDTITDVEQITPVVKPKKSCLKTYKNYGKKQQKLLKTLMAQEKEPIGDHSYIMENETRKHDYLLKIKKIIRKIELSELRTRNLRILEQRNREPEKNKLHPEPFSTSSHRSRRRHRQCRRPMTYEDICEIYKRTSNSHHTKKVLPLELSLRPSDNLSRCSSEMSSGDFQVQQERSRRHKKTVRWNAKEEELHRRNQKKKVRFNLQNEDDSSDQEYEDNEGETEQLKMARRILESRVKHKRNGSKMNKKFTKKITLERFKSSSDESDDEGIVEKRNGGLVEDSQQSSRESILSVIENEEFSVSEQQ